MLPELMSEFYATKDIQKAKARINMINSNSQPKLKGKSGKKRNYNTKQLDKLVALVVAKRKLDSKV